MDKEHISSSFLALCFELASGQYFNLVLTAFRRKLTPGVNRLTSLQLQRLLQGDLGTKVFDCIRCFHRVTV